MTVPVFGPDPGCDRDRIEVASQNEDQHPSEEEPGVEAPVELFQPFESAQIPVLGRCGPVLAQQRATPAEKLQAIESAQVPPLDRCGQAMKQLPKAAAGVLQPTG